MDRSVWLAATRVKGIAAGDATLNPLDATNETVCLHRPPRWLAVIWPLIAIAVAAGTASPAYAQVDTAAAL